VAESTYHGVRCALHQELKVLRVGVALENATGCPGGMGVRGRHHHMCNRYSGKLMGTFLCSIQCLPIYHAQIEHDKCQLRFAVIQYKRPGMGVIMHMLNNHILHAAVDDGTYPWCDNAGRSASFKNSRISRC